MVGVLADNKHKRFYKPFAVIGSVNLQLAFCVFVTGDAVQQHHFIELLIAKVIKINIGTGNRIRSTGIAILNRLGQRILIYHIFERYLLVPLGHKGCSGQFQPQQRMQFVECLCALFCPIVVGFIHNEDQIRQFGQILIERVANQLVHFFHVRSFLVELIDVVYENMNIGLKQRNRFFAIIVIRDNLWCRDEAAEAAEHIFFAVAVAQILFQLLINRCIRRHNKEVADVVLGIQIGNERTHQPGLAHTGSQSKGQRHEVPLKIGTDWIHGMDSAQRSLQVHPLAELHSIDNLLQNFERLRLRLAQGHDAADIVCGILRKMIIHPAPPLPLHRHRPADVQCSGCNRSCRTHSGQAAFAVFF